MNAAHQPSPASASLQTPAALRAFVMGVLAVALVVSTAFTVGLSLAWQADAQPPIAAGPG